MHVACLTSALNVSSRPMPYSWVQPHTPLGSDPVLLIDTQRKLGAVRCGAAVGHVS